MSKSKPSEQSSDKMTLKEWRWSRLFEQQSLAKKIGITQSEISRIESGKIAPSLRVKRNFKEVFGDAEFNKIIGF